MASHDLCTTTCILSIPTSPAGPSVSCGWRYHRMLHMYLQLDGKRSSSGGIAPCWRDMPSKKRHIHRQYQSVLDKASKMPPTCSKVKGTCSKHAPGERTRRPVVRRNENQRKPTAVPAHTEGAEEMRQPGTRHRDTDECRSEHITS